MSDPSAAERWRQALESWRRELHEAEARHPPRLRPPSLAGGEDAEPVYGPPDVPGDLLERVGLPGKPPFTRGVQLNMYRGRLWTMRQYAGFGTATETNRRFHYLLAQGQTGLSVAFDLPTQMGLDGDHPRARGEVGKVGVAISSLEDMERLLEGLPLDQVSTSMTINATAAILLALYVIVAERRGIPPSVLRGTIQNDILKEYIARGTYIFPPRPSLRLIRDVFAWCEQHAPRWNTISISGYHIREAGADAVQELAFTFGNAIAYVETAAQASLDIDRIGPQLSFFFAAHNHLLEEVAKFRAARRLWERLTRERFGARTERARALRFHVQTAGSTLQAQQPLVNAIRTTVQALAAVLGGCQSLHTNSYDEALSLPTEQAATLALRTQQVLAYESGVADIVDPLGGSWAIEALTDRIESRVWRQLEAIDAMGGMVAAIEQGYVQREIQATAYAHQLSVERGERVVVGVNRFVEEQPEPVPVYRVDPALEREQVERLRALRARRDEAAAREACDRLRQAARGDDNLVPFILDAVRALATVGEISDALRDVFGEHVERVTV
ncbi:MAG: methylmalonyl-CoA mutase family protein [Myxococcales bacterium]|nr:methylmalonyl-CoA mutase family protein [Myxococcales bacterium]